MKKIKFLLIIMLILNLVISIILAYESKKIRDELANMKVQEQVTEFTKKTENINYITNGNVLLSKYTGYMTTTQLSKKISDFMSNTVPKIAIETQNMKTQDELEQYYNDENIRSLTGINKQDINKFYSLVNEIRGLGETNLEFESAEYDENSIKVDQDRSVSGVLKIKYKNVDKTLDCYITASFTSTHVEFIPNSSN